MRKRAAPVPVMVGGTAIIAIRCLSILLLLDEFGLAGIGDFIATSTLFWDTRLILFASLLLLVLEIASGAAAIRGHNWGRWFFAASQAVIVSYMLLTSFGWISLDLFSIPGTTSVEILPRLLLQKIPDVVVLILLFVPFSSRRYFLRRRQ